MLILGNKISSSSSSSISNSSSSSSSSSRRSSSSSSSSSRDFASFKVIWKVVPYDCTFENSRVESIRLRPAPI